MLLGQNIVSFFIVGKLIGEMWEVKRKCRHWTHGITVILAVAAVDSTITKVDVPSVNLRVLSH